MYMDEKCTVLVTVAIGNTMVSIWAEGGFCARVLARCLRGDFLITHSARRGAAGVQVQGIGARVVDVAPLSAIPQLEQRGRAAPGILPSCPRGNSRVGQVQ